MWSHWDDRFADLWHYDKILGLLHRADFFTGNERFAYPAPAALIYSALLGLGRFRLAAFTAFILILAAICSLIFFRALQARGLGRSNAEIFVVILCVTSWPLVFLIERANIEVFVIALNFLGALAYWRGRPKTAAVLWGLAASIKIYPLVLFAMFFNRKQANTALIGVATFVLALLVSFWWVGPTMRVAAEGTLHGIGGFVTTYAEHSRRGEIRFDHSYLALIKAPLTISRLKLSSDVTVISRLYLIVAAVGATILYLRRVRHLSRLNQFALLSIAMISLPPVSYDYTLCHLYPSFALLVLATISAPAEVRESRPFTILFWCFSLLLASENFIYWKAFHFNGPIKGIALIVATIMLLRHNIPEEFALRGSDTGVAAPT